MRIEVKTGSEFSSDSWRYADVFIGSLSISTVLIPTRARVNRVEVSGRFGYWKIAEYEIEAGVSLTLVSRCKGKSTLTQTIVVGANEALVTGHELNGEEIGYITGIYS